MKKNKLFDNLFVLDLANNHFGDLNHTKKIISSFSKIRKKYNIHSTIKFQFRQLPEFIHKDFRDSNLKYVRRFLDTKLSDSEFLILFNYIKKNKFLTSCTPFDEKSVDKIEKFKFDFIKIASVSALDFNLHERVIKNKIPKIISTGGIALEDIDKIVSFYLKEKQIFALMHCVSIYPSQNDTLNLNFISNLKERYQNINIGWSTHENPNEFMPAPLAAANGATIFEKHIGIDSKKYKLNDYSIKPNQFENWYLNLKKAQSMMGNKNRLKKIFLSEKKTIRSLSRGIYAKKDLKKNEIINSKNVYFALPINNGQMSSIELKPGTRLLSDIKKDKPIKKNQTKTNKDLIEKFKKASYLHKLRAILNYHKIKVGEKFDLELSHHKGISNFERVGCYLFNIVNNKYTKKLLVMLPNQKHPSHFHKRKTETFVIHSGNLTLTDGNKKYNLKSGDVIDLKKSSYHKFQAGKEGCIFEEISTTSFKSDSYYKSQKIKKMSRDDRKTYVNNWFFEGPRKVEFN